MKKSKNIGKIKTVLLKTVKIALSVLLSACILLSAAYGTIRLYKNSLKGDYTLLKGDTKKAFATEYSEVKEYTKTKTAGRFWRDGMIGGNGKLGFVTSGSPYSDTITYQDVDYIMPSDRDRFNMPDLTFELQSTKQKIINLFNHLLLQ